jgi:hypothetical protein
VSYPSYRNCSREEAEDLLEAVRRAGGKAKIHGPYATGRYGIGILQLPDVGRFVRAAASVGVSDPLFYSAGSGWHLAEGRGS